MAKDQNIATRNEYFQNLGMKLPPTSSKERLALAKKLLNKFWNPDHKTSLMLFDPAIDKDNADWLNLLSKIYFQEGDLYNPQEALLLAQKAISLGSNECISYVIKAYAKGLKNHLSPDYKKAVQILKQTDIDDITWENIFICIESFEKNSGLEDIEYQKSQSFWDIACVIEEIYDKNEKHKPDILQRQGIYKFIFLSAVFCAEGYSVDQDYNRSQKLYNFVNNEADYIDKYINVYARFTAFTLAVKSLINPEEEKLNANIRGYINHPFNLLDSGGHKYFLRILSDAYNNRNTLEYIRAVKILQPFLQGEENTQGIVDLLENPEISENIKTEIQKIVTLTSRVAIGKYTLTDMYYVEIFSRLQANGIDANKVFENTINYGPFYNPLSTNTLPVVGELLPMFHGGKHDGDLIQSGKGFFNGLTANNRGEINFSFTETPNALIFDEDIDALLVLAFSEKIMLWPSIDVPEGKNFKTVAIRKKITEPAWLLNTELGRTLYAIDVLAGELSWSIENFVINDSTESESVQTFKKIKVKLLECGNRDANGMQTMINVNPKHVDINKRSTVSGDLTNISISPNSITVSIDGFFKSRFGKIKHHNSLDYSHTQKTRILTEHFNDIAFIFPIYERLRQIIGITYSLAELKRSGFSPSESLIKHIKIKRNEFKSGQTKERSEFVNYLQNFNKNKR